MWYHNGSRGLFRSHLVKRALHKRTKKARSIRMSLVVPEKYGQTLMRTSIAYNFRYVPINLHAKTSIPKFTQNFLAITIFLFTSYIRTDGRSTRHNPFGIFKNQGPLVKFYHSAAIVVKSVQFVQPNS